MKTYVFSRYNFTTHETEFRKVVARSLEQAEKLARWFGSLFSITKAEGYHALNINERINAKGNAGLLYTTYNRKYFSLTERPAEARLIVKRISKRDPKMFTPGMLLDANTKSI